MKRKKFLKLSALGLSGLLALPAIGYVSPGFEKGAVQLILNEFHYLKLDREGVERYVKDYSKIFHFNYTNQLKIRSYHLLGIRAKSSSLVESFTHNYILSTDFFQNKMDESKTVKYLGLYSPYKTPCANPFSNIYYPSTAS